MAKLCEKGASMDYNQSITTHFKVGNIYHHNYLLTRWVRAELARAIARAEGFSARLGSARDLFYFSSDLKIDQKRAENFFIMNLFGKWLNYVLLCYINSDKWLWNWLNSWYRSKNLKKMLLNNVHWKICYLIKYILSARFQLENWSAPAWLGSEPS